MFIILTVTVMCITFRYADFLSDIEYRYGGSYKEYNSIYPEGNDYSTKLNIFKKPTHNDLHVNIPPVNPIMGQSVPVEYNGYSELDDRYGLVGKGFNLFGRSDLDTRYNLVSDSGQATTKMFRQIVFLAVVAFASSAPSPGFLHGGYHLPAATSYSSRVDVHHSKPIIHSYATPIIAKTIVAEPIHSYSAPLLSHGYGLGQDLSLGHGYGVGLSSGYGHGLSSGYGHGLSSGYGLGLSSGYGHGLGHGIGYGHGW
ncbi:unnamed protein product [Brassicogethes aeneus]|uniref:Uncharacterized protein n=1 Tax=Brassicogethes aeneus TaxID=1431903 RepID=A0A9P0AS22_BRAAE|nr:unnamed protein product [Brassicogethes aeneus]